MIKMLSRATSTHCLMFNYTTFKDFCMHKDKIGLLRVSLARWDMSNVTLHISILLKLQSVYMNTLKC